LCESCRGAVRRPPGFSTVVACDVVLVPGLVGAAVGVRAPPDPVSAAG